MGKKYNLLLYFSSSHTIEWVFFTLSQSCVPVGPFSADDHIFAPLAEKTERMRFVFLFNLVLWVTDHDFVDDRLENSYHSKWGLKAKIIYTLTHSSIQSVLHVIIYCLSSNKIPDYSNKTSKLQMHWERSNSIQLVARSRQKQIMGRHSGTMSPVW